MTRSQHIQEFLEQNGYADAELQPLAGDASFRRYLRVLRNGESFMLMDAPPEKENVRPFIAIAKHLYSAGYSAPSILAQDPQSGFLLLEDLGNDSFTSVLKRVDAAQKEPLETLLYEAAIDVLAQWHHNDSILANPAALALPAYGEALLLQEVSLFADWYLPQLLGKEKAAELRGEYLALWQDILRTSELSTNVFVHRDYHADNLMWLPERDAARRVGLLDFQDGVYGDAAYDMVSLLEDARRDVPEHLAEKMIHRYLTASHANETHFRMAYAVLGAQRNSKIIGIFVRLAVRDGKAGYLNFLPRVWKHLERDLAHPVLAPLFIWLERHVPQAVRGNTEMARSA